jgi:phosphonate transport system permease protein
MKTTRRTKPASDEELKPSRISPTLAAIISAVIPGLGQMFTRNFRRGLVLLIGFFSAAGLLIWRFILVARRDVGFVDIFTKGIRLQPVLLFLTLATIVLWIWIIVDAYLSAKRPVGRAVGLFLILIVVYFSLGWQIGQVDLVALVTQIDDAESQVNSIAWPWSRAITTPEEYLEARAILWVPCTDDTPPQPPREGDEAYLEITPNCGDLGEVDGSRGTPITLRGYGLLPNAEVRILWNDPLKQVFTHREAGEFMFFPADENGEFEVDITLPYRLVPPTTIGAQDWTIIAQQVSSTGKPEPSLELKLAVEKMIETIFIGMMATLFGIILAIPFSFLAARNLMSGTRITLVIYYLVRMVLNLVRSIEPLIWAIIFVIIVGLGPFAGILALTIHSIAALGKLYSESIESIDSGPIEAVQATGANWTQTVMYAVVPQIIPPFVSFTIYRWDINIRMSTIIGFVGGGGIGYLISQWISKTDFKATGIAMWFIAVTVAILDYVSAEIRERYV